MQNKPNYPVALSFLTLLFFMWGFITCLNDILIPHFKNVFELSYVKTMLIQFAFFGAYFIGAFVYFIISGAYGDPINRIGYKNGILLGLLISAIGTFLFYPAAEWVSFNFFLTALFVLAIGFTILQISANPYTILLGPPETGAHRLNLAGAINSFGTTIAPLIGGTFILTSVTKGVSSVDTVKMPYLILTGAFILLMLVFKKVQLPKFTNEEKIEKGFAALKFPQLTLGILAIFFYVGGEVTVGSFLTSYAGLPEILNISAEEATVYVSLYWGSLMIGRFTGAITVFNISQKTKKLLTVILPFAVYFFILLMLKIKSNHPLDVSHYLLYLVFIAINILFFFLSKEDTAKTLYLFSFVCMVLLLAGVYGKGEWAMWSVVSLGLYNSVMWPNIFSLAIAGLGKYTSQGSSLLIMAILGGALVPLLQGVIADKYGVHVSFLIPVVCYLYLAFYGFKMRNIIKRSNQEKERTSVDALDAIQ